MNKIHSNAIKMTPVRRQYISCMEYFVDRRSDKVVDLKTLRRVTQPFLFQSLE